MLSAAPRVLRHGCHGPRHHETDLMFLVIGRPDEEIISFYPHPSRI